MTPEGSVKSAVFDFLKASGLLWFRMQAGVIGKGSRYIYLCPEGTADALVFVGATPVWIELKGPGQRTERKRAEKQAEFRERVLSLGHRHLRCESVDELKAFLEGR